MEENQCILNVEESYVDSECWSKQSIHRIPSSVKDLNRRAYMPQTVSFGPYHHSVEHLKAMEEHKHRALSHFLRRANKAFQNLVDALTPVLQDLKDAYDHLDPKWVQNHIEFLKMMIIDGCFILEIMRTSCIDDYPPKISGTSITTGPISTQDYANNDPIFSKHGKIYIVAFLKRDMMLLENQIPMKVLEVLASIQQPNNQGNNVRRYVDGVLITKDRRLTQLILDFFSQRVPREKVQEFVDCKYLHILDLYRKSLLLGEPARKTFKRSKRAPTDRDEIIRSATELNGAGIDLQAKTRSLKYITFHETWCGGVLKLPRIVVDESSESLYLNMIAYERFHVGAGNEVTSYIFFMDSIIDNSRDVSLLHSSGILQNALGSDKAVAHLFNSLSRDITLDPLNPLCEVDEQIGDYCHKHVPRWRNFLWHKGLTNPWGIMSFFAAILLFVLAILQTIYTILAYVRTPS